MLFDAALLVQKKHDAGGFKVLNNYGLTRKKPSSKQ